MVKRRVIENVFEEFELDPKEPVFTTGVVCKLLKIPIWVLKQLDNEGLVSPPRKSEKKSRLYSVVQIRTLKKCWYFMNKKGVKVNGLRIILSMEKERE